MRLYLVHRWDGHPHADWYPWLKEELEKKGWKVIILAMPDPAEPNRDVWVNHLEKIVSHPDQDTYFIGHSIGCQTIIRYLATLPKNVHIGGILLVAGWLTLNIETEEEKRIAQPWLEAPIDFQKVKEKTKNIIAFFSTDDPFVPLKENTTLFKKNLGAKIIIEKNQGHYNNKKYPQFLKEIEKSLSLEE